MKLGLLEESTDGNNHYTNKGSLRQTNIVCFLVFVDT